MNQQLEEGWVGSGEWRRYAITARLGQRTVVVSMPAVRYNAMPEHLRKQWVHGARQRVATGKI